MAGKYFWFIIEVNMNVVIIGANRGIGLEFCKKYKELSYEVYAVCRNASSELESLGVHIIENVDVGDDQIISTLSDKISCDSIDILIHNAGILKGDSFPQISLDKIRESFEVNTLGPFRTIMALKNKLKEGSKVGIVSSRVGSIADNESSNNYAYRISKTAVNMLGKCLAIDLKEDGISVILLHPGYVRTQMTGGNGLIDPPEAARGLVEQVNNLSLKTSGSFYHSSGEQLPW